MPDLTELDRLIEEGLTLYGAGDLDGALLVWEQALSMDPENAQANSYVDYVRMNYEMLTTDAGNDDTAPFGISTDEPEYQIEILPGDGKTVTDAPMHMDPTDAGWFMDEEPARQGEGKVTPAPAPPVEEAPHDEAPLAQPLTLEMEADAPPPAETAGVSFEDATREYQPRQGKPATTPPATVAPTPVRPKDAHSAAIHDLFAAEGTAEFQPEATAEFQPEGTPGFGSPEDVKGFASQLTDVRKRDLGFVKPTEPQAAAAPPVVAPVLAAAREAEPDPDALPAPPPTRPRRSSSLHDESPAPPPASSTISLSYAADLADDLISSLPSPKPSHITRDLPSNIVPPHGPGMTAASSARLSLESFELGEPELPAEVSVAFNTQSATREIGTRDTATRDFGDRPTQEISQRPIDPDPLVSAPTRELGLRTPGSGRALTEDEPTGAKAPLDPRRIAIHASAPMTPDGTRSDIVLPFDPIDARTAQILDDVDETAPPQEAKEDRTRRRITTLLERATEWSKGTDLDRAVAAVDLALSEDPNSALAQKLVHRNRDAIMTVFQTFLGDLNRQPALARPLHELATAPISPRAAFLLSRVDGSLSLDEILDVSGMPRLEAYRYLCQLFLRGILR